MFLRVMGALSGVPLQRAFSGWLLDVLFERFPEDMRLLAMMTAAGRWSGSASGDCEPVLAAIPHRDRVTQIATLSDIDRAAFRRAPRGRMAD